MASIKAKLAFAATALAVSGMSTTASAEYPERPVRMVVGYAPGGGADVMARIISDKLSKDLGGTFIVENKPGGATTLAASIVAKAEADGYTIMMTTLGTAVSSYLMQDLPYDYGKDLKGVAMIATNDFAVIVPKTSEINSIEDLVRVGRERELTFSSSGINSPSHLITSEIGHSLGIKLNHVPYSGSGEAMTAVLGGEVELNLSVTANAAPAIADGQVKGVAVTSKRPNTRTPDLPPLSEKGIENYEALTWYGIVAPAGVPDDVMTKLNSAINAAVKDPTIAAKLEDFGYTIKIGTAEEFQAYSVSEVERWLKAADLATH